MIKGKKLRVRVQRERVFTKKRNKNYTDERMKPSPSYAGPIVTSLATVFAASGACLYAVNVQKIFGGSTPSTITNTEWLAATEASFQNGVEREGAPGKPIAVNPMSRNVSP